jgi:GntR family transcriptional regulator, transcriptional repressor for pyruvate dehydrogenase complex
VNKKVSSFKPHSKVYVEIVHQIRTMISQDGLKPGDKIPSERELSERLDVGRSSVREALRALELLGLIETRRGEGTFLRDFREHHLVELLGMFILQDEQAKFDVLQTKMMLEKETLRKIISDKTSVLKVIEQLEQKKFHHLGEVFKKVMKLGNNYLAYKIWNILNEYAAIYIGEIRITPKIQRDVTALLRGLENQENKVVLDLYENIREFVEK